MIIYIILDVHIVVTLKGHNTSRGYVFKKTTHLFTNVKCGVGASIKSTQTYRCENSQ